MLKRCISLLLATVFLIALFPATAVLAEGEGGVFAAEIIVSAEGDAQEVQVGKTLRFYAQILPEDTTNQTVLWSIENETGEAIIDENGLFTAVTVGTIIVRAEAADGSEVFGEKAIVITEATPKSKGSITVMASAESDFITNGNGVITGYQGSGDEIVIPGKINGKTVTAIGASVFKNCTRIRYITIPKTVKEIGVSAFEGCTTLEDVILHPDHEITEIKDRTFYGCTKLKIISDASRVVKIGNYAFYNTGVDSIPVEMLDVEWIGDYAFYGSKMRYLGFNSWLKPKLYIGKYAFANTQIEYIPYNTSKAVHIDDYAFSGCRNLTTFFIMWSIPAASTFGKNIFKDCSPDFAVYYRACVSNVKGPTWLGYPCYPEVIPTKFVPSKKIVTMKVGEMLNRVVTVQVLPANYTFRDFYCGEISEKGEVIDFYSWITDVKGVTLRNPELQISAIKPGVEAIFYEFPYPFDDMYTEITIIVNGDTPLNGWQTVKVYNSAPRKYYAKEGSLLTGWQTIDGKKYYFKSDGSLYKGWILGSNGARCYADTNTGAIKTGWQSIDRSWYYFDLNSGQMAKDWLTIGKDKFYLDPSAGKMRTGWQKISGSWYYFYGGSNGRMAKGWLTVGKDKFYLDPSTGKMRTGWQTIGGSKYYFITGNNGRMVTGTYKIGGVKYRFASNGKYLGRA